VIAFANGAPALRLSRFCRGGWLLGMMLSALSARAEAPPSREFWEYLIEFGNAQGDVFDPADYAVVTKMPAEIKATPISNTSVKAHDAEPEQSNAKQTSGATARENTR
jgi:hypothetical protein